VQRGSNLFASISAGKHFSLSAFCFSEWAIRRCAYPLRIALVLGFLLCGELENSVKEAGRDARVTGAASVEREEVFL
jgi:hypothetical protein